MTSTPRRRRFFFPLVALVVAATTGLVVPAHADCVGFGFRVDPRVIHPGGEVEARGTRFTTCEDVAIGCAPLPDPEPLRDIEIWFHQGGRSTLLETVDADARGGFEVTLVVPEDAVPGKARIDADGTVARVRITRPAA